MAYEPSHLMIKAVIYDLDDLMVNSAPAHLAAFDAVLKKYGHNYLDLPEKLRAKFVGMRIIDILGEIVKYYDISEEPASLHEKRQKIFLKSSWRASTLFLTYTSRCRL